MPCDSPSAHAEPVEMYTPRLDEHVAQRTGRHAGDAEREDVRRAPVIGHELAKRDAARRRASASTRPASSSQRRACGRQRLDGALGGEPEAGGAGRVLRAAAQALLLAAADPQRLDARAACAATARRRPWGRAACGRRSRSSRRRAARRRARPCRAPARRRRGCAQSGAARANRRGDRGDRLHDADLVLHHR